MGQSRILGTILLAVAAIGWGQTMVHADDLLTIGSDAPKLDVEHWVQNGNGKFKPVTSFEKGKIYVIEFWATWCGPCIQSMPHLAGLQKEYASRGVQLISISDEDLETVEKFLDREVRGPKPQEEDKSKDKDKDKDAKPQTYRELTSAYCLTTDPDQSSSQSYMEAAAQSGIPTAFIVGKDSKIEWIGHPMEMDEPLAAVVAGSWDREAFAKEMKARQEAEKKMQEIFALFQQQKFDEAIALIDEVIAKNDDLQMKLMKLQVYLASGKTEEASKYVKGLMLELGDQPQVVNMISWNLYEMASQGRLKSDELIENAIAATEKAVAKADASEKGSVIDTLAHLLTLKGEHAKALELEQKAIKIASDQERAFMQQFIDELKSQIKEKAEAAKGDK